MAQPDIPTLLLIMDEFLHLWTHISFISTLFGKLSKSLTSLANVCSSFTTLVAVLSSCDACPESASL